MTAAYTTVNQMLVSLFNHIMRIEEDALTLPRLSIREVHVIEAICLLEEEGNNTMRQIATHLGITQGSLSVSVRTLERKGYVIRLKDAFDKRLIRVEITKKAEEVNQKHRQFHHHMTDAVIGTLQPKEITALVDALTKIDQYFITKEKQVHDTHYHR